MKYKNQAVNSQAQRIIDKFGGAKRLSEILSHVGKPRDFVTIYRWTYPKSVGGTDGLIPTAAWPDIFLAARFDGVVLSSEEMDPRPTPVRATTPKTGRPPLYKDKKMRVVGR